MTASAYLVHATRQRTRLRIPDERGNEKYFERAARLLSEEDGVTGAQGNPLTASLLLRHGGPLSAETLGRWGAAHGLFDRVERFWPRTRPLARASQARVRTLDERLRTLSSERLDLRTAAGVVLAMAAIVQAGRGQILAPATSLLWYAIEALGVMPPGEHGEPGEPPER
jgi:hypothetical protein